MSKTKLIILNLVGCFALPALFAGCSALPMFVQHRDALTPDQHLQLGTSYESQGLSNKASEQYEAALHEQKKFVPALIAQGNLAFDQGNMKKAGQYYRRALSLDKNNPGANNNLAMVYLTVGGDLKKAHRYAEIALRQGGPLRPYVLETLVHIYLEQGLQPEALSMFSDADATAPSDNTALCEQLSRTREIIYANE